VKGLWYVFKKADEKRGQEKAMERKTGKEQKKKYHYLAKYSRRSE
jgi:hypothetical protein